MSEPVQILILRCFFFFFWKAELSLTSFSVFFMPGSTDINYPLLFLLLNSIVLAHQVYLSVIVYVCIKCKRLCYKWKINVLKQHLQRSKLWTNLTAVLPQGVTVVRKIVSKLYSKYSQKEEEAVEEEGLMLDGNSTFAKTCVCCFFMCTLCKRKHCG